MRHFTDDERRARLAVRHRLARDHRAATPAEAAEAVVALHSTDPASVVVSAWARMGGGDAAAVERALYEDRDLVRVMGMRRTVFVARPADAALIAAACGRDVAARERRTLAGLLDGEAGLIDAAETLVMEALHARGEATASEIAEHDERLRHEVTIGRGAYVSRQKLASRVLTILAAEGRIVRARPRGSWTSTQFRWAALDAWCPGALPALPVAEARAALARRWLGAFGPATPADLKWWTGWTARDTKQALADAGAIAVALDGAPGVALPDDLDDVSEAEPAAALLPALDPTTMGWKERSFYLGEHATVLFDGTGNAGPTLWWDGRVVGGWAQRPDGEIGITLLEDPGREAAEAIAREAEALQRRLGDVRLAPRARGRSPLEAALLA